MAARGSEYNPFRQSKHEEQVVDPDFNPFPGVTPTARHSADPFSFGDDHWTNPWSDDSWMEEQQQQQQQQQQHGDTLQKCSQSDPWTQPDLVEISFDSTLVSTSIDKSTTEWTDPAEASFESYLRTGISNPKVGKAVSSRRQIATTTSQDGATQLIKDAEAFLQLSPPRGGDLTGPVVELVVEERLSILFDSLSSEPTCRVVGFVYMTPPEHSIPPFYLTLRDRKYHVERFEAQGDGICENITTSLPPIDGLEPFDHVFQVDASSNAEEHGVALKLEAPIIGYSCVPKLKPIPLLLKAKVQRKEDGCRVGIRVRANPSNTYTLTRIAIVVIVPPDINGEQVTVSRKGCHFDELKRTLSWTLDQLRAGECIDVQANFAYNDEGAGKEGISKFPILVRCDGNSLFSRTEISGDAVDAMTSGPVHVEVTPKTRMLYRKV